MVSRTRSHCIASLLAIGISTGALCQVPPVVASQPATQTSKDHEEPSEQASDPLGRTTPHGTVIGFLQNAQSGKIKEAAQYLQLSKRERNAQGERLVKELHALMDNAFVGRVGAISDRPEGSVQVGVPQDHERIGVFRINGSETDVDLVHVSDPVAGDVWLFSSKVLAQVPDLFSQIEGSELEAELPGFLVRNEFFSTPLWRVLAFVLLIFVSFGVAWVIVHLARLAMRGWARVRHHPDSSSVYASLSAPAILILTVLFHLLGIYLLGAPLLIRVYYYRAAALMLVAGIAWLIFPLINRWGERARRRAMAGSSGHSDSLVFLGQKILKVLVVVVAVLLMLSILGFDMTTAIAGLGIGSIAIAFAAQKTLENLLGGISILGDQVIRVGETCRVGEEVGTVEDISLRSTRIRTLARTELSVPNGQLANMSVENISRSDKSLFKEKFGVRHETSSAQLRSLLAEIRELLHNHSKVDANRVRVRFVGFGESSLDIEINCHILTNQLPEFLAIREELLLRIMDIVAEAGVGFAFPTRTLYLNKEADERARQNAATADIPPELRKTG